MRREGETERGEERKERRDGQGVKPPKKDSPNKDTSSAPTNHYNDPLNKDHKDTFDTPKVSYIRIWWFHCIVMKLPVCPLSEAWTYT